MYKACVIVLSDREYTGEEGDSEGRKLEKYLKDNNFEILVYKIIPEVEEIYRDFLIKCCDDYCVDLVVTVGNRQLSEMIAKDIVEENSHVNNYRRKKTLIKNLDENNVEENFRLEGLLESIKKL